jgi:hypothetical protein
VANRSLLDLTELTTTADTDLLHVNSGGTDYKESKFNFLQGSIHVTFSTTSSLTDQLDALQTGTYLGSILSNGHQTETGVPKNSSFYVVFYKYSNLSAICYIISFTGENEVYYKKLYNGSWDTKWKVLNGPVTHTATAASGLSIARWQCYEEGGLIHCSGVLNVTTAKNNQDLLLTVNDVSVPSTTDIVGATNSGPAMMIILGNQIKANMAIPTGYVFFNFSARIS